MRSIVLMLVLAACVGDEDTDHVHTDVHQVDTAQDTDTDSQ